MVVGSLAAGFALAGIVSSGAQQEGFDPSRIVELRLFLLIDPGMARGEIVSADPYPSDPLAVPLEDGVVMFRDDGSGPDRSAGDGVFTADFALDATGVFATLKAPLGRSVDVLRNPGKDSFVRLGSRDIVAAADAIADGSKLAPDIVDGLRRNEDRASRLLEHTDPLGAAEAEGIDIAETPFWRVRTENPAVEYLFEIPLLTVFPSGGPEGIDADRSLLVVDPRVLDHQELSFDACENKGKPGSPWSFGHLMRELAKGTGITPEEFTRRWLATWKVPHPDVNGWNVRPRDPASVDSLLEDWRGLSGGENLDVDHFPARLLAIVNRPDLAGWDVSRLGIGAGEARFVFGLMTAGCARAGFTAIFEYVIPAASFVEVKAWQHRWKELDRFRLGSDDYAAALERVTRSFTDRGSTGSKFARVRTNENALGPDWQMREFVLQPDGLLGLAPIQQTPDGSINQTSVLVDYLRSKEGDILQDRHVVPPRFPGDEPFLGAVADYSHELFFWSGPIGGPAARPEPRRRFSLATCDGCHAGETTTFFTHLGAQGWRDYDQPATPSGFLVGATVEVPLGGGLRRYHDLAERGEDMSRILERESFMLLGLRRSPFVH